MNRIKRSTSLAVWLVCLTVPAIFDGCTFKKPVTPSWDVHFELPLIDSTYTMQTLADENKNNLATDPVSHNIIMKIDKGPESFAVGKYLTAKAITNPDQFDFFGLGRTGDKKTVQDTLDMENTILVKNAVFDKGSIEFKIVNLTGYSMKFHGKIFSLIRNNAAVQVDINDVASQDSLSKSVDLTDVRFEPLISDNHTRNRIPYEGEMEILDGASNGINIVLVKVKLKGVTYRSATGWLNRTEVVIDTTIETGIEISDELRGIQINSAILTTRLSKEIRFPATFDLKVTGYADDGRPPETIQIPIQQAGESDTVVTNSIEFARIANLLPTRLRIFGTALLGDGFSGDSASIRKDDLIKASIHCEAPLIFSLPSVTNNSEVDTIDIKEDAREKIQKNALDAKLIFEIDNAVPLGAAVSFCFGDTLLTSVSDTSFYTYADLIKTISLNPASTRVDPTDPDVKIVSQPSKNTISIGLSKDDLAVFESPKVFWQRRITFMGTNGMVKIRPEDYIRVRARIEATINTDFEKDDEKGGGS